jgi:hypothetical protein
MLHREGRKNPSFTFVVRGALQETPYKSESALCGDTRDVVKPSSQYRSSKRVSQYTYSRLFPEGVAKTFQILMTPTYCTYD